MANFFVPSKQVLTPELYIPGQVPNGPVVADKTHQHNASTVGWWLANKNGPLQDLIGKSNGALVNNPTIETVAGKRALTCNGTTQYVDVGDSTTLDGATEFTISFSIYFNSLVTAASIVRKWAAGGKAFYTAIDSVISDELSLGVRDGTNTLVVDTTDANLATGQWHDLDFCWDGGNSSRIYRNLTQLSTSNITAQNPTHVDDASEHLSIMARYNGGSPDLLVDGAIRNIRLCRRALSYEQLVMWRRNPYASLQPPGPEYLTFSTGAGATVLSIADLSHAHALDSADLTQAQLLSIADSTHAHTLDNVALTQAQVLAIANALHAHGLDAMTLQTGDTLIIAGLDHAHTLDPANLVQAQVLAIADVLHTHTLDGITLDLGEVTLVISDLLHAHLLDACNVYPLDSVDTPAGRVFLIEHESRIFAVAAESRIFQVQ